MANKKKTSGRRPRIALYAVVTLGLSLMQLFRSRLGEHASWGTAFADAGRKLLLFALLFAVLEIGYSVYLYFRNKA